VCTSFSRTILPLRTAIVNRMCENDLHDDEGFDRDIHSSLTADPAYRRSSPAGSRCFEVLVYSTTAQWNAVPAMLSIERCSRSTESQVVSFSLIHVSLYPHHTAYSGSIVPLLYYPPYACVRAIYQLRPAADPAVESRGFITPIISSPPLCRRWATVEVRMGHVWCGQGGGWAMYEDDTISTVVAPGPSRVYAVVALNE
jgi:hypothetical protein